MYFLYKAINNEGEKVKSFIEANDEKTVLQILKKSSLNVVLIKEVKKIKREKVKSKDIIIFTRLFSRLINSNIPVIQSLKIIQENIDSTSFKNIINNIIGYIEKGDSLSTALGKYKKTFSPFYCGVIKAGENSGKLNEILELLFKYIQASDNIKKKFQSALIYPVFILITAFVILSLIFVFVIPQFKTLFNMFDAKLPALTELIFLTSLFFKNNLFFIILFFGILICSIMIFLKSKKGQKFKDKIIFKIPLVGNLIRESIYTKFCQIFSILIQSNVNILSSFNIMEDVMDNHIVKNSINSAGILIKNGKSITEALIKTKFFPPTVIQMIKAGEESGELDKMLESASQFYEENLTVKIDIFSSLLQPVLIILIGLFIAIIIISIFLPVFQLSSVLR